MTDSAERNLSGVESFQKFYITFGSAEQFPFHNGYIVVQAPNRRSMEEWFLRTFPGPKSHVLNCSFVYTMEKWEVQAARYYVGVSPLATYVVKERG